MKTKKTPTGVIEYYDNSVIKRLDGVDQCINLDWFKHYQAIANRNNFLVKVHRVVEENTAYEMEKLDVVSDVAQIINQPNLNYLITRSFICKVYEAVNTTWVATLCVTFQHCAYAVHYWHHAIVVEYSKHQYA